MRKRKEKELYELIQSVVRHELIIQASSIVEQCAYDYLKTNHIDMEKVKLETDTSNCSFEVYAVYESTVVEIAHYHIEDCLWVAVNQDKVYIYLSNAFKRFFKFVAENIVIDERN